MAQVEIKIGMYHYQIACKDGQEEHLHDLARRFDQRVTDVAGSLKRGADIKTIVTASLFMENEIEELRQKMERLKRQAEEAGAKANRSPELSEVMRSLEAIAELLEKR
ncbi:MAG: cell division protein ZapA [Alphaproteobacteria bacterium]|nr:cell division protein ZapA [Alphaproteobacteria bacterium]